MKKYYEAPAICFEDFSLSTSIAGTCESIVNNATKGTCALLGTGGIAVFTGAIPQCDYTPTDMGGEKDDEYDGFCYHVPTSYANLFNS